MRQVMDLTVSSGGQKKSMKFRLRDEPLDIANRFITEHKLDESVLPQLLRMIHEQMAKVNSMRAIMKIKMQEKVTTKQVVLPRHIKSAVTVPSLAGMPTIGSPKTPVRTRD